jgi:hypothetical protein
VLIGLLAGGCASHPPTGVAVISPRNGAGNRSAFGNPAPYWKIGGLLSKNFGPICFQSTA